MACGPVSVELLWCDCDYDCDCDCEAGEGGGRRGGETVTKRVLREKSTDTNDGEDDGRKRCRKQEGRGEVVVVVKTNQKAGRRGPQGIKKDMVGRDRPSCPWHLGHAIHAGGAVPRAGLAGLAGHGIGFGRGIGLPALAPNLPDREKPAKQALPSSHCPCPVHVQSMSSVSMGQDGPDMASRPPAPFFGVPCSGYLP